MFFSICQAGMLTLALSLDTFTAGLALGAQKIRVPMRSLLAISLTCSASLWIAIVLGGVIGNWISPRTGALIGCAMLMVMGSVRLFDGLLKEFLHRCCENREGIVFRLKNLKIFLQVCVDSAQADFNRSKSLSVPEAVSLAVALSVDGLAAGFGAGMLDVSHGLIFLMALFVNFFAATAGCSLGNRFCRRFEQDISWAAGAVLIVLGLMKLI